jgi:DNA topoisomerase-2
MDHISKYKYQINGKIQQLSNDSVRITELPIRVWTQNYKDQLEEWISGIKKKDPWILVRIYLSNLP